MMVEKELFPLSFSVEVSAFINAIRSSLDILATSLAHRYSISRPDQHHFPVASSAAQFGSGKGFKGAELIKRLPKTERKIIESLKPYCGGNDLVWALHQLNNLSKHRRLLIVDPIPLKMTIFGNTPSGFIRVAGPGYVKANGETMLGFIPKNATDAKFQLTAHVTLDEFGILERKPILTALHDFTSLANSIIELFN